MEIGRFPDAVALCEADIIGFPISISGFDMATAAVPFPTTRVEIPVDAVAISIGRVEILITPNIAGDEAPRSVTGRDRVAGGSCSDRSRRITTKESPYHVDDPDAGVLNRAALDDRVWNPGRDDTAVMEYAAIRPSRMTDAPPSGG